MIIWMMVGIKDGPRPRSTSLNSIKTFSNLEQGRVVDIFCPTCMSCTVIPTISYLGGRVDGIGPISNSPITTNSVSWWSQQYITFALVMGKIVSSLILIYASLFNINSWSLIVRVILAGIWWPRSTSTNIFSTIIRRIIAGIKIPKSTTYVITWVIVPSLNIPMSTTFLTQINCKTFFFRTSIVVVTIVRGRMDGLTRPISYTSITTHRE